MAGNLIHDEGRLLPEQQHEEILKIDLEWNDVVVTYKTNTSEKQILKGMSGYARAGEFLAIMGTSGAGKTTLMNLISGSVKSTQTLTASGEILANGQNIESINYFKYVGYVTQEDILLDMLTVKESVMFAARLKTRGTTQEKEKKVQSLLEEMGLIKCQHTLVGNPVKKGISGGEKKRTCVAIELITTPSILFLDEPTSGLDSFTSYQVMELLNQQAVKGRTVVSTIHQPSSDIFMKFDKLLLLCDGHVMFHGPSSEAVQYFSHRGLDCPPLSNPADYFMEILHIENLDQKSPEEEERVNMLMNSFKSNQKALKNPIRTALERGTSGYVSSYPVQIYHCTIRAIKITVRNPGLTFFKLAILLFVALLVDILFWDIGEKIGTDSLDPDKIQDAQQKTNNRNGSLFFLITTLVYSNLQVTILNFPLIRQVFLKESRSKMYGTVAFFFAKNVADFVIEVLSSIIFGVTVYWCVGYNTSSPDKPVIFLIVLILAHMCGTSLGLVAGAWFTRVDVASSLGAIMTLPFYYFSGFLRPESEIWIGLRWFSYFSPFRYSFFALMLNEYKDRSGGEHVLKFYSIEGSTEAMIGWLILVMLAYRVLGFIGLKYNSRIGS
jgi:ABC-type multidrug transport system ATPase subunit